MTESIKVLGRTLRLLSGTNRKHYVSSGEVQKNMNELLGISKDLSYVSKHK